MPNDIGQVVYIPPGHSYYVFPVPASPIDARDDATKILDTFAVTPRGAAPHVTHLLDEGEDG